MEKGVTFVVKDECIKCKLMDCIEVCPTDCFREGENMLVIDPEPCIDCSLCAPECPVDAIVGPISENDELTENERYWLEINTKYSSIWPEITAKGNAPADADDWRNVPGKKIYFSDKPGNS